MTGNRQHDSVRRPARHGWRIRSPRACSASATAFAAAVIISGCASPPRGGAEAGDLVCHSAQQCRVRVEVTCAPACRAAVDHPRVFARGNDIVWVIDNKPGQAYVFRAANGIAFKSEAGKNGFRCHVEANGSRYACMNQRTPGEHEYGVALDGSPAVPVLDPWIVNR